MMPLASAARPGPPSQAQAFAELRVAIVSASADDDRLARPDRDGQPFVLDQALGPFAAGEFAIADELLTSFRVAPRRVARPDTEDPARELALADDLVHVAVEHELDALLLGAQLQWSGDRRAPPQDASPATGCLVVHYNR